MLTKIDFCGATGYDHSVGIASSGGRGSSGNSEGDNNQQRAAKTTAATIASSGGSGSGSGSGGGSGSGSSSSGGGGAGAPLPTLARVADSSRWCTPDFESLQSPSGFSASRPHMSWSWVDAYQNPNS
jgi:hypothetical protein